MRSTLLLVVTLAAPAEAQRRNVVEVGLGALGTAARHDFAGVVGGLGVRPGGGQGRLGVAVAGGAQDGTAAIRAELHAQFLVNPRAQRGVTPYGGMGVAYVGAAETRGAGYLTVLLGLERAAGRRRGWYLEVGLGGGVRVAAGLRLRHLAGRPGR